MYKPGTQLIIIDVWAAIVARELRFEIDSGRVHWDKKTEFWNTGFSVSADKWRITVTESGPNAAERFLPQVDDVVMLAHAALIVIGVTADKCFCKGDWFPFETVPGDLHPYRIIERDGIPFPQFSEVIEP
jgi:hypothetical protein